MGGGRAPASTAIESFTVTPNPVVASGNLTLSWRAVNTGLFEGSPYCTLQRTIQSSPADDAQQVDCDDTITAVAPSEATTMTYRLSALKRDRATYVTRDVTVTVQSVLTFEYDLDVVYYVDAVAGVDGAQAALEALAADFLKLSVVYSTEPTVFVTAVAGNPDLIVVFNQADFMLQDVREAVINWIDGG